VRGLVCIAGAEWCGGGGQLCGEGRGGSGGGAERGCWGCIDMSARHGLPDRCGWVCGLTGGIGRRGRQSLLMALATQPAKEATQQRGVGVAVIHILVLELQLQSCLLEVLRAAAGKGGWFGRKSGLQREGRKARIGGRLLRVGLLAQSALLGAGQGAALAPIVQAIQGAA
jgi:hypothetical protein